MSRYFSNASGADTSGVDGASPRVRILSSTVLAMVPAALLFALAAATPHAPYDGAAPPPSLLTVAPATADASPLNSSISETRLATLVQNGKWPLAQTMLVTAASAAGDAPLQWRGRLEAVPPIRGRAPLTGQVARVSVRVGQSVSVSDSILEISTGPTSRAARAGSRVERRQSAAESAQVQAANEQAKLQQKMRSAETQLAQAQERVARAQKRVDGARDIIRRLQRGESIPAAEGALSKAPRRAVRRTAARSTSPDSARQKALAAAEDAHKAARVAHTKASALEREAQSLEAKAKTAAAAVKSASAEVATTQKSFDAGTAKASALDVVRAALEEAESTAKTSAATAEKARRLAAAQADAARLAQSAGQSADKNATRTMRDASVFGETEKNDAPEPTAESSTLTVADAARMTRAALAESAAAVALAKQLKGRVDTYARQVSTTRSDLESTSRQLASAQDAVLDQTIQTNLSLVRAPASGVVESVANVAQGVSAGDTVVSIARYDRLRVVWNDSSGAWRRLREDTRIPVVVSGNGSERAASARIDSIERQGNGAIIEAFLNNPRVGSRRLWRSGWEARATLPRDAVQSNVAPTASVRVPLAALLVTSSEPSAAERVAVLVPLAENATYRIEWRAVRTLARDENGVRISGIKAGERVALQPEALPAGATRVQLVG